ncbi:hypothetical protein SAMN05192553_103469 [Cyclobacterium xiamenense]|uniref:Uncharacterized protein n=2 Tax=Cyclobacterium xiamenense TaxID=1297121 RepID=A0A1H6YG27_9BACT|nr:hypothetical protein SAMN05192553_103469 [Cyclobacterium xiamenense]
MGILVKTHILPIRLHGYRKLVLIDFGQMAILTNKLGYIKWKIVLLLGGMVSALVCKGQERVPVNEINENRKKLESRGMLVLGSWAVGNMLWGGIGAARSEGKEKSFHQMNLYWNSVNLAIAGLGYLSATRKRTESGLWQSMRAQQRSEKILLVNAALDLGYMTGGFYLKERGKRLQDPRLSGFGNSLVLQGAFLLVFDGILYTLQNNNGKKFRPWVENIDAGATGLGVRIPF